MFAEAAYASPSAIFCQALDVLQPPKRQTVAEYALDHRFLANAGGGYVGRWRHDLVPYIVEPMNELTSLDFLTVAVVGPGQSAKTSIAENWMLHTVGSDPADMLWFMQTDDGVEAYVKSGINPLIDAHDELRLNQGLRSIDDSLHFKRFRSCRVEFLSATLRNLINKRAPRLVVDEVDAYAKSLGDVKALFDVRRQTFGRQSMVLALSHPDMARGWDPVRDWTAGIMAIYADSDRRVWYWPCPHCGAWSSPVPFAARHMAIEYPVDGTLDEIEAEARLVCPVNGCLIEDHHRRAMNLEAFHSSFGGWVGEGQELSADGVLIGERVVRKTAGFYIVGAMSPFILGGIGGLARARVKAEREREVSGEDETLRQVMVKQWGYCYAQPKGVGSIDANELAERAEPDTRLGVVPEWVRFLTVAIDCQVAHFEWLVRGWGVKGESTVVARGRLAGDPATSETDWDSLLDIIGRSWPLASDPTRGMAIRAAGYDSAGAPGVTQQAYAAWTRWRAARFVRLHGKISGREAWSIIPLKGASGLNAPKLLVTYPETNRKANVRAGRGVVPVATFNPNLFKDDLYGQLARGETGPWYVHFPGEMRSKEPPHVWFEQLTAERKLSNGRWEKVNSSARNEALDLMVMNHVVAHLHGLSRIDWEKPPGWAASWPSNALVTQLSSASDVQPSAVSTVSGASSPPRRSLAERLA